MPKPPSRTAPDARLADADTDALAPLDDSVHAWSCSQVQVGGNRLNVRITPGAGSEAAVFVHGLGGSALNWTEFAGVLRNRLAVHAIDLPGHGRSGPSATGRYGPELHADAVIGYIEQQLGGPVHLAGNSMGGAISILVAAKRPELVRTLTLVSPAVPDNRVRAYPLKNDPRLVLLMLPVLGELAVRRFNARYAPELRLRGTIKVCFADPSRYPQARLREAVEEATARIDMPWAESAVLRSMRSLAVSQFFGARTGWQTMRGVTAPSLIVWGTADKLVAPDLAAYVAAAIPDSRLLVLDDVGHTAMMEDPVLTARAMIALLEDAAVATR